MQEFHPYTDLINTICEALRLHSPWTYYTNNTSPTVVPKRWNWTQENLVSTVFVSCRPAYKKKILLDRFFKNLFFPHLQRSMLEFFSYDVTLSQLPEPMKAVVLSTSLLLYSLTQNQWIWANLSNRGVSLIRYSFRERSTSFPNIDLINKRHAM